jgi:alpha-2-macroglobulin
VRAALSLHLPAKGGSGAVYRPDEAPNQPDCEVFSVSFQVATYRRPEFEVTVNTDRADYAAGETISATAQANYYFGGNVAGAAVKWSLFARDYIFNRYRGSQDYTFGDYDFIYRRSTRDELVAQGEGVTDASGRLIITATADIAKYKGSATLSFGVSVTDLNDQSVAARAEATVHKGAYYLGVATADYIGTAGKPARVNVIAVDWEGRPLPDQETKVSLVQRRWYSVLEEDRDGNRVYTSVNSDTEVVSVTVRTDADGLAVADLTPPDGGVFRVIASAAGEAPDAATYLWVSSGSGYVYWRVTNDDRIELKLDKSNYNVGDVMKVLVPSPFSGTVNALLTVERGSFLFHKVVQLRSNSDVLEIPVEPAFAPNAYVSVLIVKGVDETNSVPAFKLGYAGFSVNREQFELRVEISSDRLMYAPRDTVTYDIRVTDAASRPVQAELSLALVDKAVLSLADPNSPPALEAFYGARGLGIRTADSLNVSVDAVTAKIIAENNKGGGGGDLFDSSDLFVRQNFKDTAYWNAVVATDENGAARVQVTLPDNLTTWKLDARAFTTGASPLFQVGEGAHEIISRKPLLIRPVTPRFFVVGDAVTLGAVVNNTLDADMDVIVTLDASGVTLGDAAQKSITVKAKGSARVDWPVRVEDAPAAVLTFTVQGGGLQDSSRPGLETAPGGGIPIMRYVSPETVATAGVMVAPSSKVELIALPPRLDTGKGALSVQVDPSLASVIEVSRRWLDDYPYDHAETIASRLIARVGRLDLARDIGRYAQRLLGSQHKDGGWGWWVDDESNPAVTAYVLIALARARESGQSVDASATARAREYLWGTLVGREALSSGWMADRQVFTLFALCLEGPCDGGRLGVLFELRHKLSHYARALLAVSLDKVAPGDARIKALLSDLYSAAIAGATGVSWQEGRLDYACFSSNTRSTAIILYALAKLDPKNALVANVARWLMVARRGDTWETNQQIAWSVQALMQWQVATGSAEAEYAWRVSLNGAALLRGQVQKGQAASSDNTSVPVSQLNQSGANSLVFEQGDGSGQLYYTARLNVYLPAGEARAINRGIVIARKYELADCKPAPGKPCEAITGAAIGQNVRVRLTIVASNDLYFVRVTDPLPGGAEAVDTTLKTSQQEPPPARYWRVWSEGGWGWWWFNHAELRDDHAALFARYLPAGTYEYTYVMRPSIAGSFQVMPASADETYFPEMFGRSDGATFTITR